MRAKNSTFSQSEPTAYSRCLIHVFNPMFLCVCVCVRVRARVCVCLSNDDSSSFFFFAEQIFLKNGENGLKIKLHPLFMFFRVYLERNDPLVLLKCHVQLIHRTKTNVIAVCKIHFTLIRKRHVEARFLLYY